jgi:hypothetical protein
VRAGERGDRPVPDVIVLSVGCDEALAPIHDDVQTMISATGMEPSVVPRDQTFCDVTIRRAGHLVVEDASRDARYEGFPAVTGRTAVRSCAGYPIESPDGHRIGALCVMDDEPRRFTAHDLALLRSLAQAAQGHLCAPPRRDRMTGRRTQRYARTVALSHCRTSVCGPHMGLDSRRSVRLLHGPKT